MHHDDDCACTHCTCERRAAEALENIARSRWVQACALVVLVGMLLLGLLAFAALVPAARGQDGGAGLRWEPFADGDTRQLLLRGPDGAQLGVWVFDEALYYPKLGPGRFGPAAAPPIAPPQPLNFGLARERLGQEGARYSLAGERIGQDRALAAVEAGVPDDGGLLRVTVIGSVEDRKPVMAAFDEAPALVAWKGKIGLKAYDPAAWQVARFTARAGKPTIVVQCPRGHVLHRQSDFAGGPEALAAALTAAARDLPDCLKKPLGPYDPVSDRDLRPQARPQPQPVGPGPDPSPDNPAAPRDAAPTLLAAAFLALMAYLTWLSSRKAAPQ